MKEFKKPYLVLRFIYNNKIKSFVVKCSPNDSNIYKSAVSKIHKIADYRSYWKDGEEHDITVQGFWTKQKPQNRMYSFQTWLLKLFSNVK